MTTAKERKVKAPEGGVPENVAFVLSKLGYTTRAEDFPLMSVEDIGDIRAAVQDDLMNNGKEPNDDINDYGDACLRTLSFLYRLIN